MEDFPQLVDFWRVQPMTTQKRTDTRSKIDLTSFLKGISVKQNKWKL